MLAGINVTVICPSVPPLQFTSGEVNVKSIAVGATNVKAVVSVHNVVVSVAVIINGTPAGTFENTLPTWVIVATKTLPDGALSILSVNVPLPPTALAVTTPPVEHATGLVTT